MHSTTLHEWQHHHVFLGEGHDRHERRTWLVVGLTAVMMVAEIAGGTVFGSLALVADGWHMSTHAAALAIAALAYRFARIHVHDTRFSFGTGKLGELAAFASAIILGMIALFIGYESVVRLLNPVAIGFSQAIPIAVVGLGVNLLSAWLLHDRGERSPEHDGHHAHHGGGGHAHHDPHRHDTNIRGAYVHVLADALTSVLAIVALLAGRFYGLTWLDPVMGFVGMVVIVAWSWSLVRSAGSVLLDMLPDERLAGEVRERLELGNDRVSDLHLWRLGPGHTGLIAAVVAHDPQPAEVYKARLKDVPGLAHVTVEVQTCPGHQTLPHAA